MATIKVSYIKCSCGHRFASPFHFGDTESFDSATMMGNTAQCPKCSRMIACNKENMSFELAADEGGFVGDKFGKRN